MTLVYHISIKLILICSDDKQRAFQLLVCNWKRGFWESKHISSFLMVDQVWKVERKKDGQLFAMKQMCKARVITKKSVNSVMNERKLLSQLKHK
jgi:hypothetical protein